MAAHSILQARYYSRSISRASRRVHPKLRKDLLVIRLAIAVGLVIPAFMVFHFIPASYAMIGIAFGLIVVGGVMALIRCGEVA